MLENNGYLRQRIVMISLLLLFSGGSAFSQTTTFTYQGRLTDGGTPANASYDLQFALWDSTAGGTQINVLISKNAYLEGSQTVNITLSNPNGGSLGTPSSAVLTIIDDMSVPTNTQPVDDAGTSFANTITTFSAARLTGAVWPTGPGRSRRVAQTRPASTTNGLTSPTPSSSSWSFSRLARMSIVSIAPHSATISRFRILTDRIPRKRERYRATPCLSLTGRAWLGVRA